MSINIDINKAAPNSFQLVIPMVPNSSNMEDNKELSLNIFSTVIPGLTLPTSEDSWMGAKSLRATGKVEYDQWNISFIVDSQFNNWQLLYNWIIYINNSKNNYMEKHKDYIVDATLKIVDNFQSDILEVYFIDIWPTNIGEVSLSHREGESILESSCTFAYDRYELRS